MAGQIKIEQNPPMEIQSIKNRENVQQESDFIIKNSQESISFKDIEIEKSKELIEDYREKQTNIANKDKELLSKLTTKDIEKLKEDTNRVLAQINIQLDFTVDKDLKRIVVKVIDKETGKVIRQIPPEEMLKIAKRMEEMSGVLIDKWS